MFRDQEFTADMTSRAVKRINDVSMLRASQFSEDAGPMAHPIRPDSYLKMVRAEKPCLRRRLWKCHASGGRISPERCLEVEQGSDEAWRTHMHLPVGCRTTSTRSRQVACAPGHCSRPFDESVKPLSRHNLTELFDRMGCICSSCLPPKRQAADAFLILNRCTRRVPRSSASVRSVHILLPSMPSCTRVGRTRIRFLLNWKHS